MGLSQVAQAGRRTVGSSRSCHGDLEVESTASKEAGAERIGLTEFGAEETIGDLDSVVSTVVLSCFCPDSTSPTGDRKETELHVVQTVGHDDTGAVGQTALEVHSSRNRGDSIGSRNRGSEKRKTGQYEAGRGYG